MPNLQIVGTQKGGTSSLYNYLTQHPQIASSLKKEIHYFSGGLAPEKDQFLSGINWYKAHFPLKAEMHSKKISIDATPMHLFNPLCAGRIFQTTPNTKIIILLRDPVERAISHYFHSKRHNFEPLIIDKAIQEESNRLQNIINNGDFKHIDYRTKSYLNRGLYLEQIKRYQSLFPAKNIMVLSSEELFNNTAQILESIYKFLDVEPNFECPNLTSFNSGTNKLEVSEETRECLIDYFKTPNQALFEHLSTQYPWQ